MQRAVQLEFALITSCRGEQKAVWLLHQKFITSLLKTVLQLNRLRSEPYNTLFYQWLVLLLEHIHDEEKHIEFKTFALSHYVLGKISQCLAMVLQSQCKRHVSLNYKCKCLEVKSYLGQSKCCLLAKIEPHLPELMVLKDNTKIGICLAPQVNKENHLCLHVLKKLASGYLKFLSDISPIILLHYSRHLHKLA